MPRQAPVPEQFPTISTSSCLLLLDGRDGEAKLRAVLPKEMMEIKRWKTDGFKTLGFLQDQA